MEDALPKKTKQCMLLWFNSLDICIILLLQSVRKKKKACKGTQILISDAMFKYLFATWKLAISVPCSEFGLKLHIRNSRNFPINTQVHKTILTKGGLHAANSSITNKGLKN